MRQESRYASEAGQPDGSPGGVDDGPIRPPAMAAMFEINPMIFLMVLPVGVFLLLREVWGTQPGIAVGLIASVIVFRLNRQRGVIGWLAVLGLVIVAAASIVGLVLDSDKAYLANDPVSDFVVGVLFLGSLAIGKPLIGLVIREMFPRVREHLGPGDRVFFWLTLIFALQNFAVGAARVALLQEFDAGEYVLWSRAVSWPAGFALFLLTGWAISRTIRRRILERRDLRVGAEG